MMGIDVFTFKAGDMNFLDLADIALIQNHSEGTKADSAAQDRYVKRYEALRSKGRGKEEAAFIAEGEHPGSNQYHGAPQYSAWLRDSIYEDAKEWAFNRRTDLNRERLLQALM